MACWVEIPPEGDTPLYWWDTISNLTVLERPAEVHWARRLHDGRAYYWHKQTLATSWDKPVEANPPITRSPSAAAPPQQHTPRAQQAQAPAINTSRSGPPTGAAAGLVLGPPIAPDSSFRIHIAAEAPMSEESEVQQEEPNPEAWVEVQLHNQPKKYFWNFCSDIVAERLPQNAARPRWVAYSMETEPWQFYYHNVVTDETVWRIPGRLPPPERELPPWLRVGSPVQIVNLTKDTIFNHQVARFLGFAETERCLVVLPDAIGGAVLNLHRRHLSPVPEGTLVELTNLKQQHWNGKVGTVACPIDPAGKYSVSLDEGVKLIQPHKVNPRARIWNLNVTGVPDWLAWRKEQECIFVDGEGIHRSFQLHLPTDFAATMQHPSSILRPPRWPLLVYLPGQGDPSFLQHTKKSLKSVGLQFAAQHFIILSPVCDWRHVRDMPKPWIGELIAHFRCVSFVDALRVYATGVGLGGSATWELGAAEPELFAAIAPVAAWLQVGRQDSLVAGLRDTPVCACYARLDEVCLLRDQRVFWDALRAAGNTRLQVVVAEGNDTSRGMYEKAYCESAALFQWLLKFQRK